MYCPLLTRVGKKYVCTVINRDVNPLIMPCFTTWTECPIYRSSEEQGVSVAKAEVGGEKEIAVPITTERKKEAAKDILNRMKTYLEDMSKMFNELSLYVKDREDLAPKLDELQRLIIRFREEVKLADSLRREYILALWRLQNEYQKIQETITEILEKIV